MVIFLCTSLEEEVNSHDDKSLPEVIEVDEDAIYDTDFEEGESCMVWCNYQYYQCPM